MLNRARKFAPLFVAGMVALGLLALVWAIGTGSTEAQQGTMHNCPQASKWAISVWSGDDGTDTGQALAICGAGAVITAYDLDPETQAWSRWFAGRPEISNLQTLNDMQGVIALGGAEVPTTPTPTPTPSPTPTPTLTPTLSGSIAFWSDRDGNGDIYVMNADGTGQTRLTMDSANGWGLAWSPDGSKIAFGSERDGNDEVYVMNADGAGQTNLTNNSAGDWQPAWSPDGSAIAFVSDRDGDYDIYVVNADGSGLTNFTMDSVDNWQPAWSPDCSKIAFNSDRDGDCEIYVVNADGTGQTNLTKNSVDDYDAVWSPDGSKIAFESDRDGDYEIYVMNADGTGQTNLTKNSADDYDPAWSPDGSKIAFSSDRDGNGEIYVMNADGTGQTNLTKNSANDSDPAWSSVSPATPTPTPTLTPTPTGPIVFSGSIVGGPIEEEPLWGPCGWWWWVIEVQLDEAIKMEQEGCFFECLYDYVPGETIEVLYFATDAPGVALGDDVEVSGQESMYSCGCGCCCDGLDFVVDPEVTGNYIRRS
jgi:Tol biopolymer transport system component